MNTASISLENYYGLIYCLETGVSNSKPETNRISTGGPSKRVLLYSKTVTNNISTGGTTKIHHNALRITSLV